MYSKENKKQMIKGFMPYCILIVVAIVLAWRAKYGFIWSDEPFYFSTANRFVQGDRPIIDEWYTAQVYSILLVPLLKIWKKVSGGEFDGIFIFFRYLYVASQMLIAFFTYKVLSKKGYKTAILAAILFMISCRGNIITISYYSVSLGSLLLSFLMLLSDLESVSTSKIRKCIKSFIVGILWGIAIVCNPYLLALLFSMYLFLIWKVNSNKVNCDRENRDKENHNTLKTKLTNLFTKISNALGTICDSQKNYDINTRMIFMGTFFVGVSVLIYVFKSADINSFSQSLEYITQDSSYYGNGLVKFFGAFLYIANHFKFTIAFWGLSFLYIISRTILKKKIDDKTKNALQCVNICVLLINTFYPLRNIYTLGANAVALTLFGGIVYLLTPNRNKTIFNLFYLTGIVALVLMCASSDTHFSATTNGCVIAGIGTLLLFEDFWKQTRYKCNYAAALVIIVSLIITFGERLSFVYRDDSLGKLDTTIESGCAKGIVTTAEKAKCYEAVSNTIKSITKKDANFYIMGFCPWGYLNSDMKCAAYTTWRIMPDMQDDLGDAYWKNYPQKNQI
ncbi:hypothetical protein [Butyrivibrio sp. NC3005]|uniref:hypothetical protein n=1 Tax=Butyrivibrio sp. NC3005 TaxID=1280685 RepID=UPI00040DB62C|nr:hypothetical protein [Butyrivibrio sp. NC3005]